MIKNDQKIALKYINLMQSAKDRKIDFNLSLSKLIKIYNTKRCFYTNEILTSENISIDRIDNDLGYIDSNIVACTIRINQLKSNMTLKEIQCICKKLKTLNLIK